MSRRASDTELMHRLMMAVDSREQNSSREQRAGVVALFRVPHLEPVDDLRLYRSVGVELCAVVEQGLVRDEEVEQRRRADNLRVAGWCETRAVGLSCF